MYDYPQATAPQPQTPAQKIVMELFANASPIEIISILKECENIVLERLSLESEEHQHIAGQKRKVLEEARNAFGVNQPVLAKSQY